MIFSITRSYLLPEGISKRPLKRINTMQNKKVMIIKKLYFCASFTLIDRLNMSVFVINGHLKSAATLVLLELVDKILWLEQHFLTESKI